MIVVLSLLGVCFVGFVILCCCCIAAQISPPPVPYVDLEMQSGPATRPVQPAARPKADDAYQLAMLYAAASLSSSHSCHHSGVHDGGGGDCGGGDGG